LYGGIRVLRYLFVRVTGLVFDSIAILRWAKRGVGSRIVHLDTG
jgi:hypothetical protein